MTRNRSPKGAAAKRLAEQEQRRAAKARTNTIAGGAVIALVLAVVGVTGALAMGVGSTPAPKAVTADVAVAATAPAPAPAATPAAPVAAPVQAAATPAAPAAAPAVAARKSTSGSKAKPSRSSAKPQAATSPSPQRFDIAIGASGYEPSSVTAQAGRPVTLTVAKGTGCATNFLMPSLGVTADNSQGPATVSLGRLAAGTYKFTCGMGMIEGNLVVR
jgi:plastocyanin